MTEKTKNDILCSLFFRIIHVKDVGKKMKKI